MMQSGLFDWQTRFEQLDNGGDPLVKLNEVVNWELFRKDLETVRDKERKSNAGRKPFDVILMFKILILQSLYNLSDDQLEFQIRDRLSFMRFLGSLGHTVPDAKTIWLFREQLTEANLIKRSLSDLTDFCGKTDLRLKRGRLSMPASLPLPVSVTAGRKISKSKKVRFPKTGAKTRNARRTPMPAGSRRTAKVIMAIRIILRWMWSIN